MPIADLIELSLEAAGFLDDEYSPENRHTSEDHFLKILHGEDLAIESADHRQPSVDLPMYLYHGSGFRQKELKPGFAHSGELVQWDNSEDNSWLYASDDKDEAILLGISSAIEKAFKLDRYQCDTKAKKITVTVSEDIVLSDIQKLHVVVYTLKASHADGWMANYNPANGIKGEYKTQRHITDNIIRCEDVNVSSVLRGYKIEIIKGEVK